MRIPSLAAALVALVVVTAHAENPFSCASGTVSKLKFDPGRTAVAFRGTFAAPAGFDPLADGLRVDLWAEPETDPANAFFAATLPASGFALRPNGEWRYTDPAGTHGGITSVKLAPRAGGERRVTLKRKGAAIATPPGGVIRAVLTSGSACVRHCGAPCQLLPSGKLKCAKSTDTALCGIRSGCELLNAAGGNCLLPYPSSAFLRDDASRPTGRRLDFKRLAMPANASGVRIDPQAWNDQLDGFSPGTMMMLNFPQGVDVVASNLNTWQDYAPSLNTATSPTILLDWDTGEVIEHFAEVDVSAGATGPVAPPKQALIIRPGRRLANDGHYIVAVRNLVAVGGGAIQPEPAFKALRDGTPSGSHLVEPRRPAFETLFAKLEAAGVARETLLVAWDFHTASDDALERWLLHMRNETFQQLGSAAPAFVVSSVEEDPYPGQICRRVKGTYQVPLYTTFDGPGSLLKIGPDGNPEQNGVTNAPFTAIIPCSLSTVPAPGRALVYGHGLLGSGSEAFASNLRVLAQTYGYVIVATDWQGMSNADIGTILGFTSDLTSFRKLPERLHQGILNQLVLAHLMGAPGGLSAAPAFVYAGVPVIDRSEVFYYGNSQGGILGGTFMALSTEVTRGVLGVPAANFSLLLQRSVDFDPYFLLIRGSYPDDLNRMLTYPIIQQLWDKAEPNGWYHHTLNDPLPGTPTKKVLVHMATGDAEVSNVATEIMVRSMGIPQVSPVVKSYLGIPELAAPFDGSAMVESDGHYPAIPITNVPPYDPANAPAHGAMRALPAIQAQIDRFLRTGGNVQNFCVGPCDPQ